MHVTPLCAIPVNKIALYFTHKLMMPLFSSCERFALHLWIMCLGLGVSMLMMCTIVPNFLHTHISTEYVIKVLEENGYEPEKQHFTVSP